VVAIRHMGKHYYPNAGIEQQYASVRSTCS
jgi:hypothetical protein